MRSVPRFVPRLVLAVSALTVLAGAPTRARAADAPAAAADDAATRARLETERRRLGGELERVNAEIATLKRADRGVRDDYRLRARLADAEALARRLTELDARLGRPAPAAPDGAVRPVASAEPRALPGDGPAELDAKADILADQARRLAARADAILGRARDLRARQSLRRHVGDLDRDPFSPLEGSKRRAMTTGAALAAAAPRSPGVPTAGSAGDTHGNVPVTTGDSGQMSAGSAVGNGAASVPPSGGVLATGAMAPGSTATTPTTAPQSAGGVGSSASSASSAHGVAPSPVVGGVSDGATLSVQLRDLLDPTTLAEIQRLEASGGATAGFEALERAGAALKARADRLSRAAASLRAPIGAPSRAR